MGSIDLSKIKSSSFFPGLQNVGTAETTLAVTGTIPPQGNLIGTGLMSFPKECMASIRVTFPDAPADLSTYWFPLVGTIQVYEATNKFYLTLYTQPDSNGRNITFDFTSNDAASNFPITGWRIQLYAHLYTYPF